ncbi:hypothetical protein ACPEEZ_06045 [Frigoribacterium sp. 2-23]|uniref:hypothetical protein n=1 Tax=Frigoribacterium sp. 2-23 TaxID=3415006 RepID=UPI003C6FC3D0
MTLDGQAVLDWREAKAETQAKEREIVATLDKQAVAEVEQRDTGVLMSCRGERMYSWAGGTRVTMADSSQAQPAIEKLAARWGSEPSHSIKTRTDLAGHLAITVLPAEGGSYLAGLIRDGELIQFYCFSRCFELPEGTWPGGSF